jgi:hypothetical protein
MSDQELVELAAKAAGFKWELGESLGDFSIIDPDGKLKVRWNPLSDDGTALRLAVALGINVFHSALYKEAQAGGAAPKTVFQSWGDDKFAATRRAIVRAAAEIGKAMEN